MSALLHFNKKTCFEDLNVLGSDFITHTYIPGLIQRVKKSMAKTRGNESTSSSASAPLQPLSENIELSFDELRLKTQNFGSNALIHDGPLGKVYSAILDDGKHVALKRIGNEPDNEFRAHVGLLSRLKHENFANFLGYSVNGNEHLLVYEFTAIGSLHDVLHGRKGIASGQTTGPALEWMQRVKIAIEAAKGLEYLHEKVQPPIVHGDICSSNVLLFDNDKAKILDFKLSSQSPDPNSTDAQGKQQYQQYLAPEYNNDQTDQLTPKGDVHSFGVVLFELLTGKNPADSMVKHNTFASWAMQRFESTKILQIVDRKLNRNYKPESVRKFAEVAYSCLNCDSDLRPAIGTVVNKLSSLIPPDA